MALAQCKLCCRGTFSRSRLILSSAAGGVDCAPRADAAGVPAMASLMAIPLSAIADIG
jgi:hypothetical protein